MITRTVFVIWLLLLLMPAQVGMAGAEGIDLVKAAVVKIIAKPPQGSARVGTGFIVRIESDVVYVVTAAHVVAGDPQPNVQFFYQQDISVQAGVRHSEGADDVTGLALLVIRGKDHLPWGLTAFPLASAVHFSGNEEVMVIGHPRGAGDWAILRGNIASRQGRYVTVDANIDEGNSGGPIIQNGEVVGMVGGVLRYGRGVTSGSVREYLEGHGINIQTPPPTTVARPQPTPNIPFKPQMPEHARDREVIGKDGAPMVLIQAGEFWMGSTDGDGYKDEHPRHRVSLDAFNMDKFEVTVARYAEFLKSTKKSKPQYWDQVEINKHGNLPVIGVDWNDADAYCRWAGKRLPTEAEWEKAARGMDGLFYPWGNNDPTSMLANFGKGLTQNAYRERLELVDSYEMGRSPYGIHHMAGNAWEWVEDWYDETYYGQNESRNPTGPTRGEYKVLRGGSWEDLPDHLRSTHRDSVKPDLRHATVGLRCAQGASK